MPGNLSNFVSLQCWTGVHLHQSCHLHKSFQLKTEQINKMTTIFSQNDHFFQAWPFWLKKVNFLSLEHLFLSHLEWKNGYSIETKSPVTWLMWRDTRYLVNPSLCPRGTWQPILPYLSSFDGNFCPTTSSRINGEPLGLWKALLSCRCRASLVMCRGQTLDGYLETKTVLQELLSPFKRIAWTAKT